MYARKHCMFTHEYSCPQRPKEGLGSPGVTGRCDSHNVGGGNPSSGCLSRPFLSFLSPSPTLYSLLESCCIAQSGFEIIA